MSDEIGGALMKLNITRYLISLIFMASLFFGALPAAAQGVAVDGDFFDEETKLTAGFVIEYKWTKNFETPWGTRDVYDPLKDPLARDAFESLFKFANEDDYFQKRPKDLSARSKRDYSRYKHISEREDVRYLSIAKTESLAQIQDVGCSFVGTRNCPVLSIISTPPTQCEINGRYETPFLTEMIGDPKRGGGSVERQFEMFFESSCRIWKDNPND